MKPLLPALLTSGPHLMNSPSNIKDDWALKITRNKFCYSFESLSIYLSFLNSHYCCTSGPWCNIQSQMVCLCVSFSLPAPSWSHVLCQPQQCLLTRKSLKGKVSIMWVHGSRLFAKRKGGCECGVLQGLHCLLEICINQRKTICILRHRHEKCVQHNLKLTHIQSQNDGVTWL